MPLTQARLAALLLLVSALFTVAAPEARAHGGAYRGPVVPPPPWVVPPYGPPPGSKGRGTTPGRNPRATTPTLDLRLWETWWGYNKEEFLPRRGRNFGQPGEAGYDAQRRGPTTEQVRASILPVLVELLRKERDKDIRNSAALAIGRVGDVREFKLLESMLDDKERTVVEAAIIGLGMLRCDRAEKTLKDLASDPGRPAKQRGLAVLALGQSGRQIAQEILLTDLGSPKPGGLSHRGRAADIETLRAMAAGLLFRSDLRDQKAPPAPDEATGHIVRAIRAARTRERSFLPTAYVALSKTRDPAAVKTVLSGLGHAKSEVRAGAAIALGRVLREPDKKLVRKLARMLEAESDVYVRRMLLISLGRIGGDEVKRVLVRALGHRDRQHRAFAAIACGLAGYGELVDRFRAEMLSSRDASMKGAYAVTLAILGDRGAEKRILHVIERDRNPDVRAHLVEALTVLELRTAVPFIEKLLIDSRTPALQGACAQALGLMGPATVRDTLLEALRGRVTSLAAKGGVAAGIGRMGDHRAIDGLVELAKDQTAQDIPRAFAVTALGILGEKDPGLPPFARFAIDAQYELRIDVLEQLRWLF